MINKRGLKLFVLFAFLLIFASFLTSAQENTAPEKTFGDKIANNKAVKYVFGTTGSDNIIERFLGVLGYGNDLKEYTIERYCMFGGIRLDHNWLTNLPDIIKLPVSAIFTIINTIFSTGSIIFLIVILTGCAIVGHNIIIKHNNNQTFKVASLIILIFVCTSSIMFCGKIGEIARGFGSIAIAGVITYYIFVLLLYLLEKPTNNNTTGFEFLDKIVEALNWVKNKSIDKFLLLYVLIVGSLYIFVNIPIISILKPILWPLTTDFGASLFTPFALEITNPSAGPILSLFKGDFSYWIDFISISRNIFGLMILRGITLGLITFFVIGLITLLFSAHKLIVKGIIAYQESKRNMRRQEASNDIIFVARADIARAKAMIDEAGKSRG